MDPFFSGGCNLRFFQGIHPLFLCNFKYYEEGTAAAPRGNYRRPVFVDGPRLDPEPYTLGAVFVDETRMMPEPSTLKAVFCGWPPL